MLHEAIGPLQDPVTWYGINYTGAQIMQWDFQNKGTLTSPARLSFVLEVPPRHLRPSVINSVPCDRILQRAYFSHIATCNTTKVALQVARKNLRVTPHFATAIVALRVARKVERPSTFRDV